LGVPMAKETKIVEAVGSAGGAGSNVRDKSLAKRLEAAMAAAVVKCTEAGITDPEKIRQAQHAARAEVMKGQG